MKKYIAIATIMSLFVTATLLSVSAANAYTAPVQEVTPANGTFSFPVSMFQDGKARHFAFKNNDGQIVRFFVVKSTDGVIRAAFDACEVCFKAKKGYIQQGNDMVCVNCGLKFRTDKVNVVTGGCNPSALNRSIQGDQVTITQQDVMSGLRYFQ